MSHLYHTLYLSSARHMLSQADIDAMMTKSRRNNKRDGVTGLLLYLDGNFIQHIEGDKEAVEACFNRICADPLHHKITLLASGRLERRQFDNWSMGFKRASRCEPADQSLFDLSRKALDERMANCKVELVQVFMQRFYECNMGVARA